MSSDVGSGNLLSHTGFEILQAFKTIVGQLPETTGHALVEYDVVLNQKDRFDLWAINIGLFQQGHASLDYRFRDAAILWSHCHNLLYGLRSALQGVYSQLIRPDDDDDDSAQSAHVQALRLSDCEVVDEAADGDWGDEGDGDEDEDDLLDDYDDQTIGQAALLAASDCIDRLFKLSMRVRDPLKRTGDARGYRHRQMCDIDGATTVDLYDCFAPIDEEHVRNVFQASGHDPKNTDHFLIRRLANANTQRRRQFGYWSQRKLNLSRRSERAEKVYAATFHTGTIAPRVALSTSEHSKATTATELDRNLAIHGVDEDARSTASMISIPVSEFAGEHDHVEFPDPPEKYLSNVTLSEFECPYCLTICSARHLRSRQWKAHLIKDLRPYLCTYQHCHAGGQLYDSFTDWMNHEVTTHLRRPPMVSAVDATTEHSDLTRECPFCFRQVTGLNTIYTHLANHLTRVALFALPRSNRVEDDGVDDSADSNLAAQDRGTNGSGESRFALSDNLSFDSDLGSSVDEDRFPTTKDNPSQPPTAASPKTDDFDHSDAAKKDQREQDLIRELTEQEGAFGPEALSTIDVVYQLGSLYRREDKLMEAEQMYMRALAGYEAKVGPDGNSTLNTVSALGHLYRRQDRVTEAEQMYVRALTGYEEVLGPDARLTLGAASNLGRVYNDQGRLEEAERMHMRALTGYEKACGRDHYLTLHTVCLLGHLYRRQGRLIEAGQMYGRALVQYESTLGPNHTLTLRTISNIADLLFYDQHKLALAEQMYSRVLYGYTTTHGAEGQLALEVTKTLGDLYMEQNKVTEAEQMYTRALAGYKKTLGSESVTTIDVIADLAGVYHSQDRLIVTEHMYVQAIAGYERALGPDHPSTLGVIARLGRLYHFQNKLAEAERFYDRALAGYEKVLDGGDITIIDVVAALGNVYYEQDRSTEAEGLCRRALAAYERDLGKDDLKTIDMTLVLGRVCRSLGRLAEAEQLTEKALDMYNKGLGKEDIKTIDTIIALGRIHCEQGRMVEAEHAYVSVLATCEMKYGSNHPMVLEMMGILGDIYAQQGKLAEAEQVRARAKAAKDKQAVRSD